MLLEAEDLGESAAYDSFQSLLDPETPEPQKAALLTLLARKRLALDELSGFRRALEERAERPPLSGKGMLDVCGTGGDHKNTFNISTLAAFVIAGDGVKVAKHGNYAAGSKCGSSNVLEAVGVKLSRDPSGLQRQLDSAGVVFLHAPLFQPALAPLGPLRRSLGFRTVFNVLGPLLNPVRPEFQLIGVSDPEILRLYHYHLQTRPNEYLLVRSADGCDELSLTAEADVITRRAWSRLTPEQLNLGRVKLDQIEGGSNVAEFAETFLKVLNGEGSEAQERVVTANAALGLQLVRKEPFETCLERAEASLRSGRARKALQAAVEAA